MAKKTEPTSEYRAQTRLVHNGELHEAGQTLSLTSEEAAQLLEVGAIMLMGEAVGKNAQN